MVDAKGKWCHAGDLGEGRTDDLLKRVVVLLEDVITIHLDQALSHLALLPIQILPLFSYALCAHRYLSYIVVLKLPKRQFLVKSAKG